MKKKIGDLTLRELKEKCNQNERCITCKLRDKMTPYCPFACFISISLDQEIEVEEDE